MRHARTAAASARSRRRKSITVIYLPTQRAGFRAPDRDCHHSAGSEYRQHPERAEKPCQPTQREPDQDHLFIEVEEGRAVADQRRNVAGQTGDLAMVNVNRARQRVAPPSVR